MSDLIETTAEVVNNTAIVPVPNAGLVRLAAPASEVVAAAREYQEVCRTLLDSNDIQTIGKKEFKKRSAWNKLAVAFGVSTTEVRTTHERDERGRIIRTECLVRATAPNGRASDGIGACDLHERCCNPDTCTKWVTWPDSGKPTGHEHCEYPCFAQHFSNPQHDIPATAFTRASNRAKADLFGMGEVSAEEVSGSGGGEDDYQRHSAENVATPASQGAANHNTDQMRRRIFAVSKKLGMTFDEATKGALGEVKPENDLTFSECRKINDWLSEKETA